MPRKSVVVAFCLLLAASAAWAQQNLPRVAVVPLNPVGVSRADATAFTGLLEVALVKTEVFDVLEQSQIGAILEAQERSVADCTDEKCAIEFGKMLAAEQIVLGSVSLAGGQYFLAAKLIDVTTTRSIRADSVSGGSVKELSGAVELLAFKLAGLTFRAGGEEQVARAFSEVFVETVPDGAEVLLNGISKGKSPLLIERVPVGKVTIEARKDSQYAVRDVEVAADTLSKLRLELAVSLGNLFIKSPVREGIRVTLDGVDSGELGTGLKEGLPAGEHQVVLAGGGYYWEGRVTLQTGKTVSVEAYPREVGTVTYSIPADAQAEMSARDYRAVLRGNGRLEDVPAQTYSLRVTGTDYEPMDATVTVSRGQTTRVQPGLKRTAAYRRADAYKELSAAAEAAAKLAEEGRRVSESDLVSVAALEASLSKAEFRFDDLAEQAGTLHRQLAARLQKQGRDDALADFEKRLGDLDGVLHRSRAVVESDVDATETLAAEVVASEYATDELRERARTLVFGLKVRVLEDRKEALDARLERTKRWRRGLLTAGWVTAGFGVAAAGLGGASYILGSSAYTDYLAAGSETEALVRWARVSSFTTLLNVGIVGGSVGLGLGPILLLVAPRTQRLEQEIAGVDRDLQALRAQGR